MTTVQGSSAAPTFDELPKLPGSEERHAWDVWGRDDQIGSLNWLGAEQVAHAAGLVRTGRVINLSCPLNEPNPGLFPSRSPYAHTVTSTGHGRDDRLDGLYPQFSSQWDGLRHVRYRQHGYWGGRQDDEVDNTDALGIERWARHGIIGRGVLLDVASHLGRRGQRLSAELRFAVTPALLDEVAEEEGVSLLPGDILLLRTGWMGWYLSLPPDRRSPLHGSVGREPNPFACPGLDGKRSTAAWLWDHRVSAVAADNVAVEALPVERADGFLHYRMIPLLGLAVGEMWVLDELGDACARTNSYEFLLASGVMNLPGGVGSPANAYAVL